MIIVIRPNQECNDRKCVFFAPNALTNPIIIIIKEHVYINACIYVIESVLVFVNNLYIIRPMDNYYLIQFL